MAILFTGKSSANASLILSIIAVSFVSMALGRHGLAGRKDPDEKVFNVLRYGAHPGSEDNAVGATIFQGPCLGPAPIKVQIAGTLRAVPDPSMYEEDFWISFENINGLLVTGTGTVDGQGNAVWKYNVGDGGASIGSLGKYQDEEDPSRVKLSDVRYHNIRGTCTSVVGVNIKCSHTVPCERVSLSNISLKYVGEKKSNHGISSVCTNAKLNYAGFQLPSPCR
ncbi:hypothetical protein OIU84_018401 [Salix udensis]|uniref:Polygalacturonase n=1 Tax=Salix udensis TaxID=889485 RepID=A0AAD6PIC6_9ROSI|nr:hypothetical protein OIU84_018401 [Salix udensis]